MSAMDQDAFDRKMAEWAAEEERAAPPLEPTEAVRERLRARWGGGSARGPWRALGWVTAAAALVVAALWLGQLFGPAGPVAAHLRLEPWRVEQTASFVGATLDRPKRGGPRRAPVAFAQLVFQHHRPGTDRVFGVDLAVPVEEPLVLAVGDRFRVGMRLRGAHHVYAIQLDEGGGIVPLFPNPGFGAATNPLADDDAHWLPAEPGWLVLVDARGEEELVVVAASEPLAELEELLARQLQGGGDPEPVRALIESLERDPPDGVELQSLRLVTR